MVKKIIILGAGLVGKAIAIDLSKKFDVTSVDFNQANLDKLKPYTNINLLKEDLSIKGKISEVVKNYDFVVGALPGWMGYDSVKQTILAGKNMVDISFFPEDSFELDELAKKNNLTIITDCGVAPGMGNIILGNYNKKLKIDNYECYVGGLPIKREWPYEYKAVFSPIDVIEEYTRPARYVQNNEIIVREALSEPEHLEFAEVGTLEAWNSDGLRSLIKTMSNIPNMIEKTLRYPGCIEYLRGLRETGFFSYDEVEVDGKKIKPIDLTAKLLFPKWELKEGEEEFTIMRIVIEGEGKRFTYNLFDKYDKETKTTSMTRTTGYTCTAAVCLMLENGFERIGINPPEYIGEKEDDFNFIINYLQNRNVIYKLTEEKI